MDENFNDAGNWTPAGVPTGTASFGPSLQDFPLIEADTALDQIEFTGAAPSYTIGVGFVGAHSLLLNGTGVTNLSSNVQGIELGSSGTLIFNSGATAGDNSHYTNLGGAIIFNGSTAGAADFQNASSGTITFNNSHAGTGEIDNNEGTVNFQNGSNADSVKIFNGATGPSADIFTGGSNAGSAEIQIFNSGLLEFHDGSSAGGATITTNFGVTNFFDASTAGNAAFTLVDEQYEFL